MKQKVAEIEAKYAMEQAGRAEDNEKARKLKEKAALHKKQALEFKSAVLRLETAVAQQARQSEDLESKLAVSNGELDEQKRVILGMGDVRTVNEQLSRSLKKEKTRNETLNALNTQMASKIAALEQQLARLQSGDPAVSSSAATSNISESSSSRVEDDESEKYYSITDTETDFEEDAAAVSSSVTASLNRLRTAQPTTRLASTFELPLKAVDSTTKTAVNPFAAYLTTRKTTFDPSTFASSLNLSEGGRRVAGPPKSKAPQKRLICQPVPPSYSLRHPNTPMVISDGLGGSRRKPGSGTKGLRRSTTSVQAKINWGPKKP
ncbi:hypothetical protein GGI07_002731 [Coemansia sp. Benny D115]|nr:hypothetical protein GGI07_002731 [Coemansia sp. Benny D115]